MSESEEQTRVSEDDLLADAIPIDEIEDEDADVDAIELEDESGAGESEDKKITLLGVKQRHEDKWNRTPNTNGQGAIHVKTFVCKLRLDAIEHLDQQVNEWLDSHPQYEVKLVTTGVGILTGKVKEEALFLNVWV